MMNKDMEVYVMTNAEIIYSEAVMNGLWTEGEMEELIKKYGGLPLHTF